MFEHKEFQHKEKDISEAFVVLLVDNQKLSRKCIQSVLENVDHISSLLEASSGREAFEIADRVKPKVILIKDDLDDLSGITACSEVRKRSPESRVILLTSEENDAKLIDSLAAGAHGYFSLNMDLKKLLSAIEVVAAGDLWVDSSHVELIQNCARKYLIAATPGAPGRECSKDALTSREIEVLSLVAEGKSNNDISAELEISLHTTKSHIRNILTKLNVNDRAAAANLLKA